MEPVENKEKESTNQQEAFDFSHDIVVTDEDGDRIAAMREYVFINVATASN